MTKIKGLDGLRAIAVISVVLTHLHIFKNLLNDGWISFGMFEMVKGTTGVQLFFVLSGFLITMLLCKEWQINQRISYKDFFVRRALRIFPLYFLLLVLLTLLFIAAGNQQALGSMTWAWLYAYNFVPRNEYVNLVGHTWSLAVEEHFYLVWPLFFSLLYGVKRRFLPIFVVGFIAASYLSANYLMHYTSVNQAYFVDRWTWVAGSNIAWGCLLALLMYSDAPSRFNQFIGSYTGLVIGILLFANSIVIPENLSLESSYIRGAGIAMLVGWIVLSQSSMLTRCLEFQPLAYIGKVSYGVYIYQGLLLSTTPERGEGQLWPPHPVVGILLLMVIVPLSYHFFEKPIMRWKKKFEVERARITDEVRT
ncbi:acyltransferase [Aestuariibacter sp. AA17]|uniref:Acyltransferase n=1 Tax=Fluctibacter corallii TaxID=2984329 RepID=A0ABT3A3Q5_9ALTE|nr:acyltransferase [Aestuariibacter sp. AA17]MCV2883283.1 acyltransferase [Aestuariibacter sp. AA17]